MSGRARYIVVGAGAIGLLLAAQWTRAGVDVVLVARGRGLDAVRERGVTVRRPRGDESVRVEVAASVADAAPTAADSIVLAVKAQDAEATIAEIAWLPLADGEGVVADLPILTVQNGLVAEETALRRFPRVIGVSLGIPASHLAPGVVVSPGSPVVGVAWVGGFPASDPAEEERHRSALARAGFAAFVEPDIAAAKRRKLLANLRNVVEVFDAGIAEQAAAESALASETRRVFAAAGLDVAPPRWDAPQLQAEPVAGHEPGHLSTWQSFARGTSVETDFLSGEVVLLARLVGAPAPLNAAIARALGAHAARGGGPGEVPLPPAFDAVTGAARATDGATP
ncbi:ketopantoate reductase family protein [Microbacterium indicum]|uniref:ketopantoate reductase family protein n=1 Tax=Microbacterium indicum TaxID=358100 RepID=UPI00041B70A6|nr:2-dehydropantoate 2-reductase N-terminal domain-containing protein [Microbacterium indicum]